MMAWLTMYIHSGPLFFIVVHNNAQRGLGAIQRQIKTIQDSFLKICIYLWLCWVLVTACRLSLVAASEGSSPGSACGLLVVAASLVVGCGLWGMQASAVVACELSCSRHVESSLIRYRTHISCIERQILNHWTTREVPGTDFEYKFSSPGGGHGNPLQYSCLENPMDRGAQQAIGYRVTKNRTWLKQVSMHAWIYLSVYLALHAWLQQHVNQELPDVQAGFRKDRGTRGQIANICWTIEKARKFQKKKSSLIMLKPLCGSQQTAENS